MLFIITLAMLDEYVYKYSVLMKALSPRKYGLVPWLHL